LLSVAGVTAHASLFVGHDSGLTHLAARLHVPTLALFGPTDPRRWAPRGPHVTVLAGTACRCEGWDEIRACREKSCLQISAETILGTCERMLQQQNLVHSSVSDCLVMSKDLC
jgi:ADP-heptose:LPS heptosyltransferase